MIGQEDTLYLPEYSRLYDLLYKMKEDIDFLAAKLIEITRGNVLELACGRGRVLEALATRYPERSFWGIDICPHYLAYCKSTIVQRIPEFPTNHLILGDMCNLGNYIEQETLFGAIYICNSSFLHVSTENDCLNLFKNVANHLTEDGIFVLEYSNSFWKTWGWKDGDSLGAFHIRRRNIYLEGEQKALRFFEFINKVNPEEKFELQVTAHLFNYDSLVSTVKESGMAITNGVGCFSGIQNIEDRKILFISKC